MSLFPIDINEGRVQKAPFAREMLHHKKEWQDHFTEQKITCVDDLSDKMRKRLYNLVVAGWYPGCGWYAMLDLHDESLSSPVTEDLWCRRFVTVDVFVQDILTIEK